MYLFWRKRFSFSIHSYILFKVGTETYDFFPMNRALCLSSVNIDSTESKIDDLLSRVTSIAMKQKEEVIYIG
jgi:inositol 1,4,5-triphosphate receptor type 1